MHDFYNSIFIFAKISKNVYILTVNLNLFVVTPGSTTAEDLQTSLQVIEYLLSVTQSKKESNSKQIEAKQTITLKLPEIQVSFCRASARDKMPGKRGYGLHGKILKNNLPKLHMKSTCS